MVLLQSCSLIYIVMIVAIIFEGVASERNAVNVKYEYIENLECAIIDDLLDEDNPDREMLQDVCHNLEILRNCQIASAVSCKAKPLLT